jgi:hypothetical protein
MIICFVALESNMEHLWRKKKIRAHTTMHGDIFWFLNNSAHSKINENCLVVVIYHYVVWLYISVNNFCGFMAIIKCFYHIIFIVGDQRLIIQINFSVANV